MQYKIPQNVQIEDKIVGPLTLKQLAIVGVGGGFTYALYTYLAKRYYIEVWLPAILPSTLLTLAIAFLKINGISFGPWVLYAIEFIANPRKRIFQMGAADHYASQFAKPTETVKTETVEPTLNTHDRIQKIGEISKILDQQV